MDNNKQLTVSKIERGLVIDHVPAGAALRVMQALGITSSYPGTVTMMMNAPSSRYGLKDIIKLEGKEPTKKELSSIALIAPYATINVIRDYAVVDKSQATIPQELTEIIQCPNESCISRKEGITRLTVESREPLRCRCRYCGKATDAAGLHVPERKIGGY